MSNHSKEEKNQSHENIDEIIDSAIDNAETRKELSEAEMDEINGGIRFPTIGLIKQDDTF
jgi:hypothetical protein